MKHRFAFVAACAALAVTAVTVHAAQVTVPGTRAWTDTGIDVAEGEMLAVSATGEMEISHWKFAGRDGFEWLVGPQGTYLYDTVVKSRKFPLPAAESGPTPYPQTLYVTYCTSICNACILAPWARIRTCDS